MVNKKLLFILGAGASKPYGFPLGTELRTEIYKGLEHTNMLKWSPAETYQSSYQYEEFDEQMTPNRLVQLLLDTGFQYGDIQYFRNQFIQSKSKSIDSFLEHRPEFLDIGKMTIGYLLLQHEAASSIIHRADDWFEYLWLKMNCSSREFIQNAVSFITFNYDRSLELSFFSALQAKYNVSPEEAARMLGHIPILHVHGQLGGLPFSNKDIKFDYGQEITDVDELKKVASAINIIHDDIDRDPVFKEAYNLIDEASQIVFLGFGFEPLNLSRLKIEFAKDKDIQSTAIGLSDGEIRDINKLTKKYIKFHNGMDCLKILRELSYYS